MTLSGEDLDTSPELAADVGCCRLEIGERIVGYLRCPDRAIVQGLASAFDDRERLRTGQSFHEEHPNLDLENSLGGALAGPASPDRPDLPVWDFFEIVQGENSVSLSELSAPVLCFEGESSPRPGGNCALGE